MRIRPARAGDVPAIEALIAPEIAAGTVLPREIDPSEFLVAEGDGRLLGCVALKAWSADVVELGAMVAAEKGAGIGSLLLMAVVAWAEDRGYDVITALTAVPHFFLGQGFQAVDLTPHALARGPVVAPEGIGAALATAIGGKARGSCAGCPRLGSCAQALLAFAITPAAERRAVA